MKKSDELKNQRQAVWNEAKNFLDKATQNGAISDEDAAKYEKFEKQIDDYDKTINFYMRQEKKEMQDFLADKEAGKCSRVGDEEANTESRRKFSNVTTSKMYKNAMLDAVKSNFHNTAEILREGVEQNGGYLVPAEWHDTILTKLEQENVMRQICTQIETSTKHNVPIIASRPSANWIGETENITLSDETFSQITLGAYKLASATKVSNELLQDSFYNLEEHLLESFSSVLAASEEDAFINGGASSDTANTQPTGFLTSLNSIGTDAYITTAETDTSVSSDDIVNLVYTLKRPYRKNATFLMNDVALQTIRKMKNFTNDYYWTPSTVEGEPDRLFGYPVYTSQFFPVANASGDIFCSFGDFSRYYIADRSQRIFKPLREVYALSDVTAFLLIERVDGKLVDNDAIKLLKLG